MREESRDPGVPRYHYSREERTAFLPEHIRDRPRKKRGLLRGNRSLAITLIDVVFLVMLFAVFSVVSRLMGDNTILPGYTISAKAAMFGDRVLVSTTVEAREDSEVEPSLRVRFSYPDGKGRVEVIDFLPATKGEKQIYRGALVGDPNQNKVYIELISGEKSGSLEARIKGE
jgi:hypothetical protein